MESSGAPSLDTGVGVDEVDEGSVGGYRLEYIAEILDSDDSQNCDGKS